METETTQPFSFEGKIVDIIGGKGKMGTAFTDGLKRAGAQVHVFDKRDARGIPIFSRSDVILCAISEEQTLKVLKLLSDRTLQTKPIITTSSTNGWLARMQQELKSHITFLTPIHVLSGPKMAGAVMIDCTDPGVLLSRGIALEIARIFDMEREEIPLENHDSVIALGQAKFHTRVWNFIREVENLVQWAKHLPMSQRRGAIGDLRVLMRPDISAELIAAFLSRGSENNILGVNMVFGAEDKNASESEKMKIIHEELGLLLSQKDSNGLIRAWVKTENDRIDQGVPGGPRSFQEFLREKNISDT